MCFRYKKLIGDEHRAISENSRGLESIFAYNILNSFRSLGSPKSTLVALKKDQKTTFIEVID